MESITTIKKLLELKVERVEHSLCNLVGIYYNHIPEVYGFEENNNYNNYSIKAKGIEIQYLKDHNSDSRRVWQLGIVYMNDNPIMVIQNAGREGDDHDERFIIDIDLYSEMIKKIQSIMPPNPIMEASRKELFLLDEEIPTLVSFYGYDINSAHLCS